jgi:VIT1/CCC1 family predicted Fe2+/Mn2+ transporter
MDVAKSFKSGLFFGLTSGVITTVGLMVGLAASTNSRVAVIGGIVTIAISDAMSDALGMHLSQESDGKNTEHDVWNATISTFLAKFVFAVSFIFPIIFLKLSLAIFVSMLWGILILSLGSYINAKEKGRVKARKAVLEHVFLAAVVVLVSYETGILVAKYFG